MYKHIFFTNVLRILDELHMTKHQLSELSGVSISFLSDLTTGKANPSLKVMEAISKALDTPLPLLLESTDLNQESLDVLAGGKAPSSLPAGFERVSVILPSHKAFIVKKWGDDTKKKLSHELKAKKQVDTPR
ncbi:MULTISPECIES: transcriptional regulator [Aeromonas]|uniref:transcriptional regulator n=1 Tax=Aeromonas TaxID=642 RepID=UPI001302DB13|nr:MULTISPECIES: transcriptional regulator [Aeromonas]KAE9622561.1 helix-turn-helix domain-containing protein [Aeromonas veronii]MCX4038151.1 transcriptional regulator [Aeromonas caviae]